ncbi:HelD family protein [Lysinibacter cavernae]|uniref:DNA helicase IV n=1 Tax=Lysinibacter cavernae TaxID=1640652 RepID=A0A7X5R3J4_9MICO|nr:AAA family ATPase [Lysinibacter cavernae]NIH54737.1 DNA helicase IV [Lysinibacter cavernae]
MFGHLGMLNGERWYIGRMGITDPAEKDTLLVDWRAPVSRPFYTATPLQPDGTEDRSTIESRGWTITRVSTETLDPSKLPEGAASVGVSNALMTAVSQHRTGRMNDIVATIQREQDNIIRSELRGTLLVQGGPGTGKTAVALHRAAFLLYEHRDRLAKSGVLIVGPNPTFLRYIGNVLPSLGEDSAILTTIGDLLPGITATRTDPTAAAELKGRLELSRVIKRAVERKQISSNQPMTVTLDSGDAVTLSASDLAELRKQMRRLRRPHNQARTVFESRFRRLVAKTALSSGDLQGLYSASSAEDIADLASELAEDDAVYAAADILWPIISPSELLRGLLTDPRELTACTHGFSRDERETLLASYDASGWSESDIPLLDEAQELLGNDPRPEIRARARARAADSQQLQYAQGVLDIFGDSTGEDADEASSVSARELVDRHQERDNRTVAERAYADEAWTYGHIIVDEAQELTPMALRSLIRRCPTQSMTLVGDIHQASVTLGRADWDGIFGGQIRRYRREDLTVNYRTPAEVMDIAAGVLSVIDPGERPSASIRSTGRPPTFDRVAEDDIVARVLAEATEFLRDTTEGTVAIIAGVGTSDTLAGQLREAVRLLNTGVDAGFGASSPEAKAGTRSAPSTGEERLWVGSPRDSKGLEFDRVIVVEPGTAERELTLPEYRDLYVALSRATQDLVVVHATPLPAGLTPSLVDSPLGA